jgi:hypothetical protein
MARPRRRDWGFFYWVATGFLIVFGALAILSIGFPLFALGMLLLFAGVRKGPRWPADLGLIAGAGLVCLLIAAINAISHDLSPTVWAIVGLGLTAIGSGLFWWIRCSPRSRVSH